MRSGTKRRCAVEFLEPRLFFSINQGAPISVETITGLAQAPQMVTNGSDGKIWFTEGGQDTPGMLGNYDPASGAIKEYPIANGTPFWWGRITARSEERRVGKSVDR